MPTRKVSRSKPKPALRHGTLAETEGKDSDSPSFSVSITSLRVRLLDPDNLCAKWFVDALRYSSIIPDDRPEDIIYKVSQKKVKTKMEEETIVDVIGL